MTAEVVLMVQHVPPEQAGTLGGVLTVRGLTLEFVTGVVCCIAWQAGTSLGLRGTQIVALEGYVVTGLWL